MNYGLEIHDTDFPEVATRKAAQPAVNAELHRLCRKYPYSAGHLAEFGVERRTATRAVRAAAEDSPAWAREGWADLMYLRTEFAYRNRHAGGTDDIGALAALVPSTEGGVTTHTLDTYRCYLRYTGLQQRPRWGARYLGTDRRQHIPHVSPILARLAVNGMADLGAALAGTLRDDAVVAAPLVRRAQACISDPLVAAHFAERGGVYEVFVLATGVEVPLGLPLGYKNRGGMRSVQHYRLGVLQGATTLRAAQQAG